MSVLTHPTIDLLTTDEVSDLLGTSSRSVRQMRVEGTGPAYIRVGLRTVRYDRTAIVAWLDDNSHGQKPAFEQLESGVARVVAEAPKNGRVRALISSADLDRVFVPEPASPVMDLDAELNAAVVKLVAGAPRLTTDQRASLAVLLGGAAA